MRLVVVSGAGELALLAHSVAEDDALFEQKHVELLATPLAAAGRLGADQRLLE